MSKSWKRLRREQYPPYDEVVEALVEAAAGNSSKLNGVKSKRSTVRGNNPKPGGDDPIIDHVDRWDALTILRTRNDLIGGSAITPAEIEAEITDISNPINRDLAMIDYLRPRWYRNHSLIDTLADAFSLTETQINNLFTAAKALEDAR